MRTIVQANPQNSRNLTKKGKTPKLDCTGQVLEGWKRTLPKEIGRLGLLRAAARKIPDSRRKASVKHSIEKLLRQRVYAIACGEEDLNDHDELRKDIALQTAVGTDEELASASTLLPIRKPGTSKSGF